MLRLVLIALLAVFVRPIKAETWPSRPLTMVVPFATGGPMDAVARILQPALSDALQQQVIVENVGGAGGMIGAARVAKSAPDGYQFVLGNVGTHAVSQTLYKAPFYNSITDFTPVVLVADLSLVMVVRKDLPANDLQEFIAYAKAKPEDDAICFGRRGLRHPSRLRVDQRTNRRRCHPCPVSWRRAGDAGSDSPASRLSVH
jgi:tripartite-type tricarboxylate transporter receptor subunit TctC